MSKIVSKLHYFDLIFLFGEVGKEEGEERRKERGKGQGRVSERDRKRECVVYLLAYPLHLCNFLPPICLSFGLRPHPRDRQHIKLLFAFSTKYEWINAPLSDWTPGREQTL